jgi:protein-L-isoaspartate O-methyltransferase
MTKTKSNPASKFRKMADGLPAKIEHLRRPMTQNSTPKRQREYASRCIDGDNLERCRLALLALADAWDADAVPPELVSVTTKDEVAKLVRHGINQLGYYTVVSTHEYADTSVVGRALQNLLDASMVSKTAEQQAATRRKREIEAKIDTVRFADVPGFFPTPAALVQEMIDLADVRSGHKVLEPSAGIGSIVDLLPEGVDVVCCEVRPTLVEILAMKGYKVIEGDFLERFSLFDPVDGVGTVKPEMAQFDRILMNPPFESGQDVDHIRHAFKLLKPGGRLAALCSSGPFFRSDRKSLEFRDWLVSVGAAVDDVPADAFKGPSAFRSTGVSCKMIGIAR